MTSKEYVRRLTAVHVDLIMLQRGEWVPDFDSIQASIDNIQELIDDTLLWELTNAQGIPYED